MALRHCARSALQQTSANTRSSRGSVSSGTRLCSGKVYGGPGIGLRRTVLHDALRMRAEELGVVMQWGTRVTGISRGESPPITK